MPRVAYRFLPRPGHSRDPSPVINTIDGGTQDNYPSIRWRPCGLTGVRTKGTLFVGDREMHRATILTVLCALACSTTVFADEVYFKNGDRLSGKIVRLTDDKLVLQSKVVGEVTVNLTDIKTFSSDEPVEVHLKDGTVLHQPVAAAEPNEFTLKTAAPLQPQPFPLADIASINPPPPPKPKWTGSVSGAFSLTTGNTKANSFTGSVSLARRTEQDRTTAGADISNVSQTDPDTGESDTTENWWRLLGQYDYFFTKKFYGFGNGRYEKDEIALLERRVVVGGGGGYQWIENDTTALSTNLGLASLFEKYKGQPETNNQLTLQAGYAVSQKLGKNTKFLQDLTYYPSLDDFSDFFLTTTAEVRTNLTKTMFANFKLIYNYDATPAPNRGSTDTKYLLGVGMNF
jgi:putative salt-induced outer membrane protein YdiY